MTRVVRKVVAYITRQKQGVMQLLVFEHVDVDAGVQVPKGTVEPNETLLDAVKREVREETGLTNVDGLRQIGALLRFGEEWNLFALMLDASAPDAWTHYVSGDGEDKGMNFRYYWTPLNPEPNLAGNQGDGLPLLEDYLSKWM